jgi:hypothetical protein
MTVNRSDFQKGRLASVSANDTIIVNDEDGTLEPQVIDFAGLAASTPFTGAFWPNSSTALTGAGLANSDRIPVLDGTVPKYIEADQLAQGSQFSSRYASTTNFPSGAWTSWTPTVASGTGTITTLGTVEGQYQQYGKLVVARFSIQITTKGTAGAELNLSLPVTARNSLASSGGAAGTYREAANSAIIGAVVIGTTTGAYLIEHDNTTPFNQDGDTFRGTFTYEAA